MNILREVRRFNKKSMPLRIISILLFSVILIVTTYAWFSSQKDVRLGGLTGDVTSWEVAYFIDDEEVEQTTTFTIAQLYPGMQPWGESVHIYNIGESSTNIKYEVVSVKIFGEEILPELDIGIQGNTTTIFAGDETYPFEISYTYDKDYLNGKYDKDDATTSQTAHAELVLDVDWKYEIEDDDSTEIINESEDRDVLDTQFGKGAYQYYLKEGSDLSKAIEIQVKITSSMIHPSLDT